MNKPVFPRCPSHFVTAHDESICLNANAVLQGYIADLLKRPVGRPPKRVRRFYANFGCQAKVWNRKRHLVAKLERHHGPLYPCVAFIATNLTRATNRVVAVPRDLFQRILGPIEDLRPQEPAPC